jgi:hypothetical protein
VIIASQAAHREASRLFIAQAIRALFASGIFQRHIQRRTDARGSLQVSGMHMEGNRMSRCLARALGLGLVALLTACETTVRQEPSGQMYVSAPGGLNTSPRANALEEAKRVCWPRGGQAVQIEREAQAGLHHELWFTCFDRAAREAAQRAEAERVNREREAEAARRAAEEQRSRQAAEQRAQEESRAWERRRAEEARQKEAFLRSQGIRETTVIDLIVNYDTLRGRKVLVRCNLVGASSSGVTCDDPRNDRQSVRLPLENMGWDFKQFLLERCSRFVRNENSYRCSDVGIVGTVTGSASFPRIDGASIFSE